MTQEIKLRRTPCNYHPENARFLLECDFSKQYSHYYQKRLEKTRPFLEFNCRNKCDPNIPIYTLSQLAEVMSREFDDNQSRTLSPTSNSPPEFSTPGDEQGNFRSSKRMRRGSESSKEESQFLRTSTQRNEYIKLDKGTTGPLSPPIESPGETPIESPMQRFSSNAKHRCFIIGTIFKRMKLQPNVVHELTKGDFHVKVDKYLGHYTSQDDKLVLEDIDETISLVGNIDPKRFVTGIVVALLGFPIDEGSQFFVEDVCFAEPSKFLLYDDVFFASLTQSSIERPLSSPETKKNGTLYLLIVSGLGFSQHMAKNSALTKALQNLIDFTWGGGRYKDDERCSQIGRILVIGDNLAEERLEIEPKAMEQAQNEDLAVKMKKSRQVKPYVESIQAVRHMDDFFAQLSKTINVDVMPGSSDPSSHMLPQQPFHPCMFPKSCMFSTFNCTTNPYRAVYNDKVEILATSGQNIDIVSKFSYLKDPIEIMKCHLRWGNMAPSAPDNLYSAPYENEDPFVIDFIPEIYVTGCQESYKTDFYFYSTIDLESSNEIPQPQSGLSLFSSPNEPSTSAKSPVSGSFKRSAGQLSQGTPRHVPMRDTCDTKTCDQPEEQIPQLGSKNCTLLITVPTFCKTYSCVLINLGNLESKLVCLK